MLRSVLTRLVSGAAMRVAEPDLDRLGQRVASELWPVAKELDRVENNPRLVSVDAWGRRVDEVKTHPGWRFMNGVAAQRASSRTGT